MKRPRRIFVMALIAVVVLVAGAEVAYRLWQSNRMHSAWCRIVGCPILDGLDLVCSAFAEAELIAADAGQDPIELVREIVRDDGLAQKELGALMAAKPEDRYRLLLFAAQERGGEGWSCPAMERAWAHERSSSSP